MKKIASVAVVLPAFDEEKDLPALLSRIQETLVGQSFQYQVIVVDDGSQDRTAAIAEEAASHMPLTLIRHGVNKGLGMGIQTGLSAAMKAADAVVVMDSDNTHDPIYVMEMVQKLETQDVQLVIASRYQPGSPDSATVGSSGAEDERLLLVTANARRRDALTCASRVGMAVITS